MHLAHTREGNGSRLTKVAIVGVLHVAGVVALVHSMNAKVFTMPKALDEIVMFTPVAPKPPPPEPPQPMQKPVSKPKVFTPPVEIEVLHEPAVEAPLQATTEPDLAPADPGPATPEAPPTQASPNTGQMFSAALTNANDCAKPDYPASAARNGETGTVRLALLIGTDGRVSDAEVQKSSGSRELDRAAVSALSMCKFKPALNNGVAEPSWGKIAYVWTLD